LSRNIDHEIWGNPPHSFERQPGKKKETDDYRSYILDQKAGLLSSESNIRDRVGKFPAFGGHIACQYSPLKKIREKALFGLQIVAVGIRKTQPSHQTLSNPLQYWQGKGGIGISS